MFIPVQFVCKIQCEIKPSKALATGFQSAKFENEYAYFLHILPHKLIFIYMFPNPLLPKARIIMHIFAKY